MKTGSSGLFRFGRFPTRQGRRPGSRRGAVIVLVALLLVFVLALCALSVDTGYMYLARAEVQRSVDAGALAGAGAIMDGLDAVRPRVVEIMERNWVGGRALSTDEIQTEPGTWDESTQVFTPGGDAPSAMRVVGHAKDRPLFFGAVIGDDTFAVRAEAIAVFQPRDIMVVLDYSGSMNDDSELKSINKLGRSAVESNLLEIYQDLGSPSFGNMQWQPQYINSASSTTIKRTLGLDRIPYPYPAGSWEDYFSYVQSSSYINNAGYRKKYGYLTLVNYWLEQREMFNETPDLWRTSEQPITAVKDAVSVFLAYIDEAKSDDRAGLSVYTAADGTAVLETGLTRNMNLVEDISRHRQAGHYDTMTNIGAGLQKARIEMEQNARKGAFKLIVLMTDGVANRPSNTTLARQFLLQEAQRCADKGYPVMTISLGAGADTGLMQQVADVTAGVHFNVPGGQSVSQYEEQLKDVFREIAGHRPLRLAN